MTSYHELFGVDIARRVEEFCVSLLDFLGVCTSQCARVHAMRRKETRLALLRLVMSVRGGQPVRSTRTGAFHRFGGRIGVDSCN